MSQTTSTQPDSIAETKTREKVVAVLVLIVGLALGLVDTASPETGAGLRVPALIATLFLVAGAINVFLPLDAKGHVEPEQPAESGTMTAYPGAAAAGARGRPEPTAQARPVPLLALGLLGLAVWLGLETLSNYGASWQLLGLSLLAAYLIFARGLAQLPGN